jgi:hypothetical protein
MKRINIYLGILVTGFFCVILSFAVNSSAANTSACSEDVGKFCKEIKPGGGAIFDCLWQHQNELSAACSDHIARMEQRREQIKEFRQACSQDTAKFCKDVKPGRGRIVRCLKEHGNELSSPCGKKLKASPDKE